MSGCAVCVYDLYEEALSSYRTTLDTLRHTLDSLGVAEIKRPLRVQRQQTSPSSIQRERNVVMNAFEAFEKSLQAKHAAESQS